MHVLATGRHRLLYFLCCLYFSIERLKDRGVSDIIVVVYINRERERERERERDRQKDKGKFGEWMNNKTTLTRDRERDNRQNMFGGQTI